MPDKTDIEVLLIDADIIIYRAGFSAQKTYHVCRSKLSGEELYDEGLGDYPTKNQLLKFLLELGHNPDLYEFEEKLAVQPAGYARHAAKLIIDQILSNFEGCRYKLFLTSNDKTNFRFDVATLQKYKGNRTAPKPVHYDAVREYLTTFWNAQIISGREADDELSLLQTKYIARFGECRTCIVTIDKDLDMVPGWHYNFVSDRLYYSDEIGSLELKKLAKTNRSVLKGTGLKWFYAQMLLGDNADNIPGIPKAGPVKVFNKLNPLTTEQELKKEVASLYKKHYGDKAKDAFNEIGTLLWMRQHNRERPFK